MSWDDAARAGLAVLQVAGVAFTAVAAWAAWRAAQQAQHSVEVSRQSLLASIRPLIVDVNPSSDLARDEGAGLVHHHRMGNVGQGIEVPGRGQIAVAATDDLVMYSIPVRNIGTGAAIIERAELWFGDEPNDTMIRNVEALGIDRVIGAGDLSRMTFVIVDSSLKGFAYVGVRLRVDYTNLDGSEQFTSLIDVGQGSSGSFQARDVKIKQR